MTPAPRLSVLHLRTAVLLTLGALASGSPAAAGDLWVPLGATRVRVSGAALDSLPIVGDPLECRSDTLVLRVERRASSSRIVAGLLVAGVIGALAVSGSKHESALVPVREIDRFEVRRGSSRSTGRGALTGVLIGGSLGVLLGAASPSKPSGGLGGQGFNIAVGAIGGGLSGVALGAIFGHRSVREHWQEVPGSQVRVDPQGRLWAPIAPTQPVRVSVPLWEPGRVRGLVRSLDHDSLVLARGNEEIVIPRLLIQKVETTWSRKSRSGSGALIGFGAGFALGVILTQEGSSAVAMGSGVGLLGCLVGSIAGALIQVPRWEEAPLTPPTLRPLDSMAVSLSPRGAAAEPPGGVAVPAPADSLGTGP